MILLGSYICYTTNTLDTIEVFITETYVQLAATESKCYSTSHSTLAGIYCNTDLLTGSKPTELLTSALALYCAMPFIATHVDICWNGIFQDRSNLTYSSA